jgi:hypothetical protein
LTKSEARKKAAQDKKEAKEQKKEAKKKEKQDSKKRRGTKVNGDVGGEPAAPKVKEEGIPPIIEDTIAYLEREGTSPRPETFECAF